MLLRTVLINTLVDIMFAVFKNELEILDYMYSKTQSRPKMSCLFFTVPLVGLLSAIVTFPGHTHFLANIFFFKYVLKRVSFGSKDRTKELKLECVFPGPD